MKPTQKLHDLGQSLWLDNITRDLLKSGTLRHYRDELSVTGLTSNPMASDVLYIKELAAPLTVNTMPEKTLKAFAEHGEVTEALPIDGGDSAVVLAQFAALGVEDESLAAKLQSDGAASFVASWNELMAVIDSKSATLRKAAA
jgi:transaldolase